MNERERQRQATIDTLASSDEAKSNAASTVSDLMTETCQALLRAAHHHAIRFDERAVLFVNAYLALTGR